MKKSKLIKLKIISVIVILLSIVIIRGYQDDISIADDIIDFVGIITLIGLSVIGLTIIAYRRK